MAGRGWGSALEKRPIHVPGVMRHGPFPGAAVGHRIVDHITPVDHLEKRMAVQKADAEQLMMDNERLTSAHTALKEELLDTQHEVNSIKSHLRSVQTESDIQMRVLLDKIAKMEVEIVRAETVNKELTQAHMEACSAANSTQDLRLQLQKSLHQLQLTREDSKRIPEMMVELDALRLEHQRLRGGFEKEKKENREEVGKMEAMEREMLGMAREAETLQSELQKVEKRVSSAGVENETQQYFSRPPPPHHHHTTTTTMSGRSILL